MFTTAIPQSVIIRLSIGCLALLAFTLVMPSDGYVAHAQNNGILQSSRVIISPELGAKMRNISRHRNVAARAALAQNLADQINGNRLRGMRTLIIDEVGMLDGQLFDKAGAVVGQVRTSHLARDGFMSVSFRTPGPLHVGAFERLRRSAAW